MSVTLRSLAAVSGAFALVVGCVATLAHFRGIAHAHANGTALTVAPAAMAVSSASSTGQTSPLTGLDLTRLVVAADEVTSPLPGRRVAHLTLDTHLQKTATAILRQRRFPEAAIVVMDPDTGAILAYASRASDGHPRDLVVDASAPSASVFKLATANALVDRGATADTRECFPRSAEQRIVPSDLVVDPLRDKWCMSLATAMGKSENAVFARMAHDKLDKAALGASANALGWGTAPLAFDVSVQPSKLELPEDSLGFARGAAGFWSATLSPLHGVELAATIARGGEAIRPYVVARVTNESGQVEYQAPPSEDTHRAISQAAADALTTMMEHTVTEGTSFKAFHDARRTAFVPVSVAGKTGTLSEGEHLYTWFVGFAPAHAQPGVRRVAIAVLVVNRPRWSVKANVVARDVLREALADHRVASR